MSMLYLITMVIFFDFVGFASLRPLRASTFKSTNQETIPSIIETIDTAQIRMPLECQLFITVVLRAIHKAGVIGFKKVIM